MRYAIIEDEKIIGFREIPEEDEAIITHYRQTETLIPCEYCTEASHYVHDNTIIPRPSMPLVVEGKTITGIPAGSVLLLGEQSFEVDDGEAEIDGYSGTVKITCWPYLDAEVEV